MSLLRDALRARKEKEKGQAVEAVVFNGPVIDADEILGSNSTNADSDNDKDDYSELAISGIGNAEVDAITIPPATDDAIDEVAVDDSKPATDSVEFSLQTDEESVVPQQNQKQQPSLADSPVHEPMEYEPPGQGASRQGAKGYQSIVQQASRVEQSDRGADSQAVPGDITPSRDHRQTVSFAARSMNLDPLFFIIIAFAFAGLFGSLYALLTQNNAFVSHEYNELLARQSALDALMEGEHGQNEPKKTIEETASVTISEPSKKQVAQSVAAVVDTKEAGNSNDTAGTAAVASVSKLEGNGDAETIEQLKTIVSTAPANVASSNSSKVNPLQNTQGGEQGLADLQDELDELRQSLASQNLRISEFINDNSALRQAPLNSSQPASSQPTSSQLPSSQPTLSQIRKADSSNAMADTKPAVQASSTSYDKAGDVTIVENTGSRLEYDFSLDKNNSVIQVATIADSESSVQIAGQHTTNGVNTSYNSAGFPAVVGQAFHAYSTGNLNQAGVLYARALQLDPYNRDANLGVAAVAMKTGNYPTAIQRYRHLLSLQPDDAIAFSAMLNLVVATRNTAIEHEMIVHSHQYRHIPSLHAALGNYYSQTARWGNASQSYAAAVRLAPETADYLYNLAVSLDNLGDSQAAVETYGRALSLSEVSTHTFSVVEASARLQALQAN